MRRQSGTKARTTWVFAAALLAAATAAPTHGDPRQQPLGQWLPKLRKGMWVKVEGASQPGGGLRAREIKILSGDLDEAEITTTITSIDAVRKSFDTRAGIRVVTDRRSEIQRGKVHRAAFADLRPGDRVETEGQLQKDGTLLADEIEIKKPDTPGQEPGDDEIRGRIESVNAEARRIVLLGTPVILDEHTKNKTPYFE